MKQIYIRLSQNPWQKTTGKKYGGFQGMNKKTHLKGWAFSFSQNQDWCYVSGIGSSSSTEKNNLHSS